jgi:DNA helicase IV
MTVVGDIAQATGPLAANDWNDVLEHLPTKKDPRVVGLSVGYRIPAQIMELADKVMLAATPGLRAPRSVREGDEGPAIIPVAAYASLIDAVVACAAKVTARGGGRAAIICAEDSIEAISQSLNAAGIKHGLARAAGLDQDLSIVPATMAKGLELDDVIVVEPASVVAEDPQGLRLLYVTLTRSTRSLSIVHQKPLPEAML